MTAVAFFNKEISIDDESIKRWEEIINSKKEATITNIFDYMYKYAGIEGVPPQSYDDLTETDIALYNLGGRISMSGGYMTLIGMYPNTVYSAESDQPIGFSHMDKNALMLALMKDSFKELMRYSSCWELLLLTKLSGLNEVSHSHVVS